MSLMRVIIFVLVGVGLIGASRAVRHSQGVRVRTKRRDNGDSTTTPGGQGATVLKIVRDGTLSKDLPLAFADEESWETDGAFLTSHCETDCEDLQIGPSVGPRDFTIVGSFAIPGENAKDFVDADASVSINFGLGDQIFEFVGTDQRTTLHGSMWGEITNQKKLLGSASTTYGILPNTVFLFQITRQGDEISFYINRQMVGTQPFNVDKEADLVSFGFSRDIKISDLRMYVTGPREYALQSETVPGPDTPTVDFPSPGYGDTDRDLSSATQWGVDVTLLECKDACDAMTSKAPRCDALVYDVVERTCRLYARFGSTGVPVEDADEKEKVFAVADTTVPNADESAIVKETAVPTGLDAASSAKMLESADAVFEAINGARDLAQRNDLDLDATAKAMRVAADKAESKVRNSFGGPEADDEEDEIVAAKAATGGETGLDVSDIVPLLEATGGATGMELPFDESFGGCCAEPGSCGDHGSCAHDTCECECEVGFEGENCESMTCFDDCSEHGVCNGYTGTCDCMPGFSGPACDVECNGRCSGHGECFYQKNSKQMWRARCVCEKGFEGDDCSKASACAEGCSSHGKCWLGQCLCDPGFEGDTCETVVKCPNDCSGNGDCFDGACFCHPGFMGRDCGSIEPCPGQVSSDDGAKVCSGHGSCEWGRCFCDAEWIGESCDLSVTCPRDCSEHGICFNGECACESAYSGPSCGNFQNQDFSGLTADAAAQRLGMAAATASASRDNDFTYSTLAGIGFIDEAKITDPPKSDVVVDDKKSCARWCAGVLGCAAAAWRSHAGTCDLYCNSFQQKEAPGVVGIVVRPEADLCGTDWRGTAMLPFSIARINEGCPGEPACNGNGLCVLGQCVCNEGFSGSGCATAAGGMCESGCSGHGICDNGKCDCVPGFEGEKCELEETCGASNCNGNGRCWGGMCMCFPGFEGSECEVQVDCPNACSGRGICHAPPGICICEPGFGGDDCGTITLELDDAKCPGKDEPCSGNGKCTALKRCICAPGFKGKSCDVRVAEDCENDCFSRGKCVGGKCFCEPGYKGSDCSQSQRCNNGLGCGAHGFCARGKCFCKKGYAGDACDEVVVDRSDELSIDSKSFCPDACNMRGICFQGDCLCSPGFSGRSCETSEAKGGVENDANCPNDCGGPGRGVCALGKCHCYPGFGGDDCSGAMPLECPRSCNNRGVCSYGKCFCDPGYEGADCGIAKPCPNNCTNGNGICERGVCRCHASFHGEDCKKHKQQPGCPNDCGGIDKGVCLKGSCFCKPPYTGKDCGTTKEAKKEKAAEAFRFGERKTIVATDLEGCAAHNCSDHGVCVQSDAEKGGWKCVCDPNYSGLTCESAKTCAPDESCGGHGTCMYGRCFCDPGWRGNSCDVVDSDLCPDECSGSQRGVCTPSGCLCAPGFEGDACELDVAYEPCPTNCSGWGECVRGQCRCFAGRSEVDCSGIEENECPSNCFGRGLCHNGRCFCHNGYTKADCSALVSSIVRSHESVLVADANPAQSDSDAHVAHSGSSLVVLGVAAAAFLGGSITGLWWLRRREE